MLARQFSDDSGISIGVDVWRKEEIIKLHAPFMVVGAGLFYEMDFCSEYIEAGQVKAKSEDFCKLAQKIWEYSRIRLK